MSDKKISLEHAIRKVVTEAIGVSGSDEFKGTPKSFLKPSPRIAPKKGDTHPDGSAVLAQRGAAKIQSSETMKEEEELEEVALKKEPHDEDTPEFPRVSHLSGTGIGGPDRNKGMEAGGKGRRISLSGWLRRQSQGLVQRTRQNISDVRQSVKDTKNIEYAKNVWKKIEAAKAKPAPKPADPAPSTPQRVRPDNDPGPAPIKPVVQPPPYRPDTSPKPLGPPANPAKPADPIITPNPKMPPPANPAPTAPKPAAPTKTPAPAAPTKTPAPAAPPLKPVAPSTPAPAAPKQSPGNRPDIAPTQQPSSKPLPAAKPAQAPGNRPDIAPTQQPSSQPAQAPAAATFSAVRPAPALGAFPAAKPKLKNPEGKDKGKRRLPFRFPKFGISADPAPITGLQDITPGNSSTHRSKFSSVVEDADTERKAIENVARPGGKTRIRKQGEIKTKIIDEDTVDKVGLIKRVKAEAIAKKKDQSPIIINPKLKNPDEGSN
jgi:hypothetical protein